MERVEFRPRGPPHARLKRPRESGSFVLQPLLSTSTNAVKAEMEEQEESSLTYGCLSSTVPFERLYMSKKRTADPLQNMVSFPREYVVRETFHKASRTESDPDTAQRGIETLDPYVRVCFEAFNSDWEIVRTNCASYQRAKAPSSVYDLPMPLFSGDNPVMLSAIKNRSKSASPRDSREGAGQPQQHSFTFLQNGGEPLDEDDLFFTLIRQNQQALESDDIPSAAHDDKRKDSLPLFEYYDPTYEWLPGTEIALCNRIRKTARPDSRADQHRPFVFCVEPKLLNFQLGGEEPFFCSLALYDLGTKKKISENFYFQHNTEGWKAVLGEEAQPDSLNIEKALFTVTRRSANVFLVLQIHKVLQGDVEALVESYSKIGQITKRKEIEKIQARMRCEVEECCMRIGRYHQPFGIAALRVFDAKGALLLTDNTIFDIIYPRYNRDDVMTVLQQIISTDPKEAKKLGTHLHGYCSFSVEKYSEGKPMLDSSLRRILDESGNLADASSPFVLEVHEFLQHPALTPNFSYINNMYIYPQSVSLGKLNAKNLCIRVEVKDIDNLLDAGLKCFYKPSDTAGFISERLSSAQYHAKSPSFSGDEFKLKLPPKLSERHHLLFTFLDVPVVTTSRRKKAPTDNFLSPQEPTVVGHAVVPLYEDGRVVAHNSETFHSVPIYPRLDNTSYLNNLVPEGKATFQMQFHLVSTIYPEDQSITDFLNIFHASEEQVPDDQLIKSMKKLGQLTELLAIQYLPVIINNLLEVMNTRENHTVQLEAFRALVFVMHKVTTKLNEKFPRNSQLELYSNYIFNQQFPSGKFVYNTLCSNFLCYMMDKKYQRGNEAQDDSIFMNSWFIFDLVVKSMVLHLHKEGKLDAEHRVGLFDDFYARTLSRLVVNLTKYFKDHLLTNTPGLRVLNQNLALFVKDLFDVMDRGIVLDMVRSYLTEMTEELKTEKELELSAYYKFEFLRIIADHELFFPLNLPFEDTKDLRLFDLTHRHPVAFTVFFEAVQALRSPKEELWELAIGTVYDMVIKSAFDSRYQSPEEQARIASTFFVLIPLLLDNWNQILQWRTEAPATLKRELYICVLFIFDTLKAEFLNEWFTQELSHMHVCFLRLHCDIVRAFEFDRSVKRATKTLLTPQVALFMKEVGTEEMNNLLKGALGTKQADFDEEKRLRHLTGRVDALLLRLLEDVIAFFGEDIMQELSGVHIFTCVVESYCALASQHPSSDFVPSLYTSLHVFLRSYAAVLFTGENNYLRELLRPVIIHCNDQEAFVHIRATTFLYTIFQVNQRTSGSFARARIQAVATLSDLVSSRTITEDSMLSRSFQRLVSYSFFSYSHMDQAGEMDEELDDELACFSRNIQDIVLTLANILRDTLRVAQLPDTGETHMKADLYYQIAEGYKNTPDLRITWLTSLAQLQIKNDFQVEAGMAYVHCAAVVAHYLVSIDHPSVDSLSINSILSVMASPIEVGEELEEGVCQSRSFSLQGLIDLLQLAIKCFTDGEHYEYVAQLYKALCPIYESTEAYKDLAQAYAKLQECWSLVYKHNTERLFGKYFRVGFYGHAFGDLSGREFIYKEPKLTHILEMSERLKTHYSKQVKQEILTMDASKSVDMIDPNKCYMQITHVEPYRDPLAPGQTMPSFFKRHTRMSRFYFETPFTKSGKAHAEHVSEQYKRKTVLSVTESFPFLLCRLSVESKFDIIVSPIENAIEDIEKRNIAIETEISNRNTKTLRQILQGSVLLQVNEGAVTICKIFLGSYRSYPPQHVRSLCNCISNFLNVCRLMLALNKSFIKDEDDKTFQRAMEIGFKELECEITSYLRKVELPSDDSAYSSSELSSTEEEDLSSDGSTARNIDPALRVRERRRSRQSFGKIEIRGGTFVDATPGAHAQRRLSAGKRDLSPRREASLNKVPKVVTSPKKRYSKVLSNRERSHTDLPPPSFQIGRSSSLTGPPVPRTPPTPPRRDK